MKKYFLSIFVLFLFFTNMQNVFAQLWQKNNQMFNSSGIPSLTFSQPRFADLDGDNDMDLILGSIIDSPYYFENIGSNTTPKFMDRSEIFSVINEQDAEVAVAADIDADGDLDIITGGYSGLNLYENIGNKNNPIFQKAENIFKDLQILSNPIPSLADIDSDDDLDLVVGFSESGKIVIYTNSGDKNNAIFKESENLVLADVGLYAYPYFCDFDNDFDFDIISGRDGYGFYFYLNEGDSITPNWIEQNTTFSGMGNTTYFNSPVLVDLDGDSKLEIIYGTATGPLKHYKFNGTTTTPSWYENKDLFGGIIDVGAASTPFFIDFDNDNDLDMISGSQLGEIKFIKNIGNNSVPSWIVDNSYNELKHSIYSSVTFGDVNNDTKPDALVGDLSGNLYLHLNTGNGFAQANSSFDNINITGFSSPRFIDFDFDEDLDVVAGNEEGNIFYFENSGTKDTPIWTEVLGIFDNVEISYNNTPALVDLDEDGDWDLVIGNLSGNLIYYSNENGTWVKNDTLFSSITSYQNITPSFADLDGDGDSDLITGNYEGTFEYYENLSTTFIKRNQFDNSNSTVNIENVYPNPFINSIELKLQLKQTSDIQVTIFNILGQKENDYQFKNLLPGNQNIEIESLDYLEEGIYIFSVKVKSSNKINYFKYKLIHN